MSISCTQTFRRAWLTCRRCSQYEEKAEKEFKTRLAAGLQEGALGFPLTLHFGYGCLKKDTKKKKKKKQQAEALATSLR